jgi:hypothetical protein
MFRMGAFVGVMIWLAALHPLAVSFQGGRWIQPPHAHEGKSHNDREAVEVEILSNSRGFRANAYVSSSFRSRTRGLRQHFQPLVVIPVCLETFGASPPAWLETFLNLKHGIPQADTYSRVFAQIKPESLQRCFLNGVRQVVEASGAQVVPIDGKSVKGSDDCSKKQSALPLGQKLTGNVLMLKGCQLVTSLLHEQVPGVLQSFR